LRLQTLQDTISQTDPLQETDFASHLRIAPGHSRLQSSRLDPGLPTTDVHQRLLGKTNKWEPIYLPTHHIHRYITFGKQQPGISSTWSFHCLRFMYNPVLSVVRYRCEAAWQPTYRCQYHGSILLRIQFLYSLFSQYTKTTETLLLLLPLFHRNNTHPFTLKPFHHGPN